MRLILHIFRKDAIHLWMEIALSWVLLAWLTQMDWLAVRLSAGFDGGLADSVAAAGLELSRGGVRFAGRGPR